jgi:hypothetical protein
VHLIVSHHLAGQVILFDVMCVLAGRVVSLDLLERPQWVQEKHNNMTNHQRAPRYKTAEADKAKWLSEQ